MATAASALPVPSEDEKNFAMINYILSIFSGWLAPLIIWIIKRESKFVAFHSSQTLFGHRGYLFLSMAAMLVIWGAIFARMFAHMPAGPQAGPPREIFLFMPLFFLVFWGGWFINMVIGIVFAMKSKNGDWTRLPLVGGWARRLADLPND